MIRNILVNALSATDIHCYFAVEFLRQVVYDPVSANPRTKDQDTLLWEQSKIRYFLYKIIERLFIIPLAWIDRVEYKFKYSFVPSKQRHIVRTTLSHTWHDSDIVMLHACFEVFVKFVDKELCETSADGKYLSGLDVCRRNLNYAIAFNGSEDIDYLKDVIMLYEWWVTYRRDLYESDTDFDEYETLYCGMLGIPRDVHTMLSIDSIDDSMLAVLMRIRRRLWT